MTFSMNKRVIVRVWTSENNADYPGHNVGHVSIETAGEYMSLWPVPFTRAQIARYSTSGRLQQLYLKYFMERDADFHTGFADDIAAEDGIEPQVVVCFYSLEHYMILNEFHKLKSALKGWRLIGRNLFFQSIESVLEVETVLGKNNVDSCVSLVFRLLKAGGITNLVSGVEFSSFSSLTSSSISVDDILKIIIPAKKEELRRYPATQHYIFPNETTMSDGCTIL